MARVRTWEISEEFWELVEPLIPKSRRSAGRTCQKKPGGGRKAVYSGRVYFPAIVYVLRTGIIWNAGPREKFGGLGSSALHARFRQWAEAGLFEAVWRRGLAEYDEPAGIEWTWQSADGTNTEAPLARESAGPTPPDREKKQGQAARPRRRRWHPALPCRQRGERPRQQEAARTA
ncbi:MAG: transposase [Verrucomicrobiota bacterium]|jgi:transposase|nr:transposase [Verrucomicrobiota bacterium]